MDLMSLKELTGESDNRLLFSLQARAENIILTETNRNKMTPQLERLLPEVILELFNRQGSEGEQSRSEGGVSVTYVSTGVSPHLLASIRNHRLARVSGRAFEKKQIETVYPS